MNVLHNYLVQTKLFSDLYLPEFLDTSAKFRIRVYSFCRYYL